MHSQRAFTHTLAFFCLVLALLPNISLAQEAATATAEDQVLISIRQKDKEDGARFEVEVKPGETGAVTVVLQNFGTEAIELRTYATGIIPTPNGGLTIAEPDAELSGSALWMDYTKEELTLQPGEAVERELVITVPKDTEPGQYVNAVVLETVNPVNATAGASFEQYFRKTVSVYVTVPGEMQTDFSLGEPEVLVIQGRSGLLIPITNSGDVRIDITGTVKFTAPDGSVVYEGDVQLGPIYKGQETTIQIAFASVPPAGEGYALSYSFHDQTTELTRTSEDIALVVPEDESGVPDPLRFENVAITPNADPIAFAIVSVDVISDQTSYRSSRLTLSVYHNGELVEDFVLAENLSLNVGESTTVTQRYLPATAWESGTYTFSLKLESTDGGQTSLILEQKDVATLEVP